MVTVAREAATQVRIVWPDGRSERATLEATDLSGGAGEIYLVAGRPDLVAKIYHATATAAHLERYRHKIEWMTGHPPVVPGVAAACPEIVQLAWPEATVLRGGNFAGFVMRKVDFDRTLELDYLLNRRQAAQEGFEVDYGRLATVACNLAAVIGCLHDMRIAVVDLKPMNVKVYKDELYVSILDCDGFHIASDGFRAEAPQVTPEYLAPEFHGAVVAQPEAQDRFALATIIFRLLNYGIHPFAGIAPRGRSCPPELAGRIRQGLYPYGKVARRDIRPVPASVHEAFADPLRGLFDRAFAATGADRPSAHEWARVLGACASRDSAQMTRCGLGHLHFAAKPCPTCMRAALLHGARLRHRSFVAQVRAAPARTLRYVQKTLRHTHTSPFQAALAQSRGPVLQLAPRPALSTRNSVALEILWILGLLITFWWTR